MNRPLSITLISILFIMAGVLGIFYHINDLKNPSTEAAWIFVVRVLAIVGGVFTFKGVNWARWLIIVWMAYHVALSFLHTSLELLIHIGFFALALYALFNKGAAAYFSSKKAVD
ncbi:MAG TPA: hypothetical protein DGG95_12450 [Cytophagales bacterium]|jgi:hypothetical protein|nr:hypothetical protein [Cytophagales bacterium]